WRDWRRPPEQRERRAGEVLNALRWAGAVAISVFVLQDQSAPADGSGETNWRNAHTVWTGRGQGPAPGLVERGDCHAACGVRHVPGNTLSDSWFVIRNSYGPGWGINPGVGPLSWAPGHGLLPWDYVDRYTYEMGYFAPPEARA